MKSVLQSEKECWVCHTTYNLHDHHVIYGRANRKLSEEYGLKVWLCAEHHNMGNYCVHKDRELNLKLRRLAQEYFEEHYGTREDFMRIFGENYL